MKFKAVITRPVEKGTYFHENPPSIQHHYESSTKMSPPPALEECAWWTCKVNLLRTPHRCCIHTYTDFMYTHICAGICHRFLLFLVVIFYKVLVNTELPTREALSLRKNTGYSGSGSCKLQVTFSLTNHYITLFYACVCLKVAYLIYTVDSLALNSQPTAL